MSDRLPPLTALRAFEAAARHLSFAKAAEELNVTPAALSFQIKSLEAHLEQPVFRRLNRAVELTEAGRALSPGATEGFTLLAAAWRAAQRVGDTTTLTVTAGPAVTAKWLAPRLFEFAQAHPEIELRLSASLKLVDFERDGVDVAIRFGAGRDDGRVAVPLQGEWIAPMMTPELAQRFSTPDSLREAPLLHQDDIRFLDPPVDWSVWFRAAGVAPVEEHGPRFSQADHALDAALSGVGVLLGRGFLAERDLAAGRLVAPFDPAIVPVAQYRLVYPEGSMVRPQVAAFRSWVETQISEDRTDLSARTMVSAADVPRG